MSYEADELRRGWKKCQCPIYASGTLNGQFKRRNTERPSWDQAKAIVSGWEAAGTWSTSIPAIPPHPEAPDPTASGLAGATRGMTIVDATESFLANRQNRGIQMSTLVKYLTFVKQLRGYCDTRGYSELEQLTVTDMDRFYASWNDGKRARAKKLDHLKGFIKFCMKRKWLTENIVEDLQAPEGSSTPANKTPFTDAELGRIYAACDALGGPTPAGPGYRNWGGEDTKDFLMLSIYTGLRISDVATFDVATRLKGNDVYLRMHKTKKELYTWIPDWLVERLRTREKKYGTVIFRSGESTVMRTMAEQWRKRLGRVFRLAGKFDERPTPHRFRHYAEFRTMPSRLSETLCFRLFPETRLGIVWAASSHGCWSNGNSIRLLLW